MRKFISAITVCLLPLFTISQNVGIGISNPTRAKLVVNGVVGTTAAIFGGEGTGISLQRDWPTVGFNEYYDGTSRRYIGNGFAATQYVEPINGYMAIDLYSSGLANQSVTGAFRALTIKKSFTSSIGNVGISVEDPNAELHLSNTVLNKKIILWESVNNQRQFFGFGLEPGVLTYNVPGSDNEHRFYSGVNVTTSTLLMTIRGNKKVVIGTQAGVGKLGINSGDPQVTLEIVQANNTGLALIQPVSYNYWELRSWTVGSPNVDPLNFFFFYNGTPKSYINYSDGSYITLSDARIKENKQSISPVLNKVLQLKPMSYQLKQKDGGYAVSLGFLAQDVKPLFPELVHVLNGRIPGYEGINDLHTLNYSSFGVIAIKAIQEQQQIIQDQQKQIDELKNQMRTLINKQ